MRITVVAIIFVLIGAISKHAEEQPNFKRFIPMHNRRINYYYQIRQGRQLLAAGSLLTYAWDILSDFGTDALIGNITEELEARYTDQYTVIAFPVSESNYINISTISVIHLR
jgi:hypothetical protein